MTCWEQKGNALSRNTDPRLRFAAIFIAVLGFFFLSGACGLLYQVVWTRKLVLLFGTTSYAVSTVLSIFFLGLGVGSLWGGRLADRSERPLAIYGVFEIIIGVWALFFLASVTWGEGLVVALLRAFDFSRGAGVALRALMAAVLLFVPVTLMGATLPLLSRYVVREAGARGFRVGALYTLNTCGAVAGCFVTGFFLIQHLGYTQTTLLGAVINIGVGVAALLLARVVGAPAIVAPDTTESVTLEESASGSPRVAYAAIAAFAVTGFSGLALEVIWTRLLSIIFLGTTYAYTAMLTAILVGIALGSAVSSMIADRTRRHGELLGAAVVMTGICALFMLRGFAILPEYLAGRNWEDAIERKFWLAFFTLAPATFFLGMTFPLVIRTASGALQRIGRDVGFLYSVNTFGGVLGAVAGGYLLLPLLGAHWSIVLLAGLLLVTGLAVMLLSKPQSIATIVGIVCAFILFTGALFLAPADVSRALDAGYIPEDHEVIRYTEGIEGTVVVSQPNDKPDGTDRVLWINRVQATTSIEKGVKMNRLQGVLPLLFDRDVDEVLFMCFGSGITCGTLALSDFERIDAVEISPDVLAAAPLFSVDNLGVIDREGIEFHIDDGRNYLLTTDHHYDFITFEPMPLAMAGVSTFYTRDYYELCRARLAPRGMVSQWVPLHSLSPEVVQSLVRTFVEVFPESCAFFINADLFLIGSDAPLVLDYAGAQQRLAQPELKAALDKVYLRDIEEVFASFIMDKTALAAFAEGGRIMTDDRPWAEFEAPKLVYAGLVPDSLQALAPHRTSVLGMFREGSLSAESRAALERRERAHANDLDVLDDFYNSSAFSFAAFEGFQRSLDIDPQDWNARYYLKEDAVRHLSLLIGWEEWDKAQRFVDEGLRYLPNDPELLAFQKELAAARAGE